MIEKPAESAGVPDAGRDVSDGLHAALSAVATALVCLTTTTAWAQDPGRVARDSVVVMGEIVVMDSMRAFGDAPFRVRRLEARPGAAAAGSSVADLLAGTSVIDIRRAGYTGVATASIRGGGATGTPIILDGFRLADPQTGVVDLSMIPLSVVRDIRLVHGPSGHTNALGGTVVLRSKRPADVANAASVVAGAYGHRALSMSAGGRQGGFEGSVAAVTSRDDGDFSYRNTAAFPARREVRHGAGRQTASVSLTGGTSIPGGSVRAVTWFSDAIRGVPGPANAPGSGAVLRDRLVRAQLGVRSRINSVRWDAGFSTTRSGRDYRRPTEGIRSFDGSVTSVRAGGTGFFGRRWFVEVGAGLSREAARIGGSIRRDVIDILTRVTRSSDRASLEAGLELTGARSPGGEAGGEAGGRIGPLDLPENGLRSGPQILPSAGFRVDLASGFEARFSAARSFRRPTLNERYWVPGGNPDLQAERGWMVDAGLAADHSLLDVEWSADAGVYAGRIADRIIWQPALAGAAVRVWRPVNIGRVDLRGGEAGLEGLFDALSGIWTLSVNASRTETLDRTNPDARSWGRQIRYVPTASAATTIEYMRGGWSVHLGSRWTGRRYTASDESLYLSPYRVTSFHVGRRVRTNDVSIRFGIAIENLENASYEVMRLYPMPPRHASFTLSVTTRSSDS